VEDRGQRYEPIHIRYRQRNSGWVEERALGIAYHRLTAKHVWVPEWQSSLQQFVPNELVHREKVEQHVTPVQSAAAQRKRPSGGKGKHHAGRDGPNTRTPEASLEE
jgi:murein DD-endopeptidase MepM/ murein hydrolase activator NlpD